MRLSHLIEGVAATGFRAGPADAEIKGVTSDSKAVKNGFMFVAVKGWRADGHRFIKEAIDRGAKAVVFQEQALRLPQSRRVSFIQVADTRKALAKLASDFCGTPSARMKVVGITGTNGKTTTSYLIEAILKEAGFMPAVIGTVNYRFKDKVVPSKNTTPGPVELQSILSGMLKAGVNYVVMEVSSHALHQARTEGIRFHSAVFTNLTQDHLDYHGSLEEYFQAKARLFRHIDSKATAVINHDDAYGRRFKDLTPAQIITYSAAGQADVCAQDIEFDMSGTVFTLCFGAKKAKLNSRLIGRHNVYNVLAACAFALKEGLDPAVIKSAVEKFSLVPGRLERIDFKGDFSVFVDYAHTHDAISCAINALRQVSGNRVIVVFGCGGDRDKTKRPKMGSVVSELADYAIITNDNPRSEDPAGIIEDIKSGIDKDNFCVIPDRRQAIRRSLSIAKEGDIVLVAGKGHENYQVLKDKTIDFDDREVIRKCLKSMSC